MRYSLLAGLLTGLAATATAQEPTSAHLVGIGSTRVLDTYISQEKFSGPGLSYLNVREYAAPRKRWSSVVEHEVGLSSIKDRSGNVGELEGCYSLYWGRYRQWHLLGDRLFLQAGGVLNATLGFIYDMSKSNNPAQARASLHLMPSGIARYSFPLLRQRFTLRYELNLPLAGLMFSPNYGQSYYEIFTQGNYDHNIVPTTPVSSPTLRHQLTLDWQTGRKWSLRIGYLGNYQQAQVNQLKQHVYAHRILIGAVRRLGDGK